MPCIWSYSCANSLMAVFPNGAVAQCDCWLSQAGNWTFGFLGKQSWRRSPLPRSGGYFSRAPRPCFVRPIAASALLEAVQRRMSIRAYGFNGDVLSKDHYCSVYRRMFQAVIDEAPPLPRTGPCPLTRPAG